MSHFPFSEYYLIDIKWKAAILNFLSDTVMETEKIRTKRTLRKEHLRIKHEKIEERLEGKGMDEKMWMNAWCVDCMVV